MTEAGVQPVSAKDQVPPAPAGNPPLCVDLDGTLLTTDSAWESLLLLVRKHPARLWSLPGWIAGGKAHFKEKLSDAVTLDASLLPYRQPVLELLQAEKRSGRRLVLATAADHRIAQGVAHHLGLFDEIIASSDGANFKGDAKLAEIERRFGRGNFDYIGDSTADLPVWKSARRAYVVSAGAMDRRARAVCTPYQVISSRVGIEPYVKALRPYQWVKNLLLFIPLILAHKLGDWTRDIQGVLALISFSFCASAIYIINDLIDLEPDRRHATKRLRPFAAGQVSAARGLVMSAGMLAAAFAITIAIHWQFSVWLAGYVALTTLYSFWLKRKLIVDVILLAGLYTLRIIAGAAAVDVELTMWMLAFSMFFFLSLAFAKRYSELIQVEEAGEAEIHGRGYQVRDLRIIESIGPASGYLAVLVFCNYLDSEKVRDLYAHPRVLWLVAPVLLYWVTRIWFIARRRALRDDPILFAIGDGRSYVCGILVAAIVAVASFRWHH